MLLDLIDEYKRSTNDCLNFFLHDYIFRFLDSATGTIQNFLRQARARSVASIVSRLGQDGSIPKRYPLEEDRQFILLIPLRNNGPGTALNVQVEISYNSEQILFDRDRTNIGAVDPGDFSVAFDVLIINTYSKISTILTITWEEMGTLEPKSAIFEADIIAQKRGLDWDKLEYLHPYSTAVAKGDEFVGRREKVASLASKILRTPMESFFVTGQKRIGKTSLALAAADFAKLRSPDVDYCYILWGNIAYENPRDSVNALGKRIADFVQQSTPGAPMSVRLDGSLAPILPLFQTRLQIAPHRKYVIIVDEFDEIHSELYLFGALAETFFANLRALATLENVCLVLVGGENMPFIMDRQGQKLNKLVRFGLDYFSRTTEWEDFKLLVRTPTESDLNWHDEAVTAVFNFTNGNPYFAKVVCAYVYSKAIRDRDCDVTALEVQIAINRGVSELDTNSFAHLWQDGIFRVGAEREPYILQRCRVLVAAARTLRQGKPITLELLATNKHSTNLSGSEIAPIIHDFIRREVIREKESVYEFVLPLFRLWLRDVGVIRLVSDALAQELAEAAQIEEDKAYVSSNEVISLLRGWPTYRGKHVSADDIRSWLEQVPSHRDQRLLFNILRNIRFFSEAEVREKLRLSFGFLRDKLLDVSKIKGAGRTDIVITYIDGEGKSGQFYASRFAEENRIPTRSILTPSKFSHLVASYSRNYGAVGTIVVIDDIVATGDTLERKLCAFVAENEIELRSLARPVVAIALAGTDVGVDRVRRAMAQFDWLDFDIRVCEPLLPRYFAFERGNGIWNSNDEYERAEALCRDLGVNIYPKSPLGFEDQGLLIVFPDTCPDNSLPIIHSPSISGAAREWTPLFPRKNN